MRCSDLFPKKATKTKSEVCRKSVGDESAHGQFNQRTRITITVINTRFRVGLFSINFTLISIFRCKFLPLILWKAVKNPRERGPNNSLLNYRMNGFIKIKIQDCSTCAYGLRVTACIFFLKENKIKKKKKQKEKGRRLHEVHLLVNICMLNLAQANE